MVRGRSNKAWRRVWLLTCSLQCFRFCEFLREKLLYRAEDLLQETTHLTTKIRDKTNSTAITNPTTTR